MKMTLGVLAALVLFAGLARAEIVAEEVDYAHGDVALRGFVAYDDAHEGKRPGVLLVHARRGHGENVRAKAKEIAKLGYVAFALDMYGKGVYAKDRQEAAKLAGGFYANRELLRARATAGLEQLKSHPRADATRLGAIGFCFGGTVVLELARHGADLDAVVSFHGGLKFADAPAEGEVKARVLVCHGADDPHVPPEQVVKFWKEMAAARARYEILILSGAVHAFTDPDAGDDPSTGAAYHAEAARMAWHAMHGLFRETLAAPRER